MSNIQFSIEQRNKIVTDLRELNIRQQDFFKQVIDLFGATEGTNYVADRIEEPIINTVMTMLNLSYDDNEVCDKLIGMFLDSSVSTDEIIKMFG